MAIETLGFLGAGQMANALAKGVVSSGKVSAESLHFCDSYEQQLEAVRQQFANCHTYLKPNELFLQSKTIVLSVKPQVLKSIAEELASFTTNDHLIISIAAGVSLSQLQKWFHSENVIRVMPNTPAQVSAGVSALASSLSPQSKHMFVAQEIFETVGKVVVVDDNQMDAVTGLSGSGPAYALMFIEALSDAGVAAGLTRAISLTLATQTVLGSAKMVQDTQLHPAVLKDQVTSPAGTTIAGIRSLEANKFRSSVIEAVTAAVQRSRELRG